MHANILTIAGSDSSGGAGIQADLKAISATGAFGLSVITALTAQNTLGVTSIYPVAVDFLREQMQAVFEDVHIDAVKVGMLGGPSVIEIVAEFLSSLTCPIVVDPVMVAKSGDRLLTVDAVRALKKTLIPLASLITPNLPEAADLLAVSKALSKDDMMKQAQNLLKLGPKSVLLKGGHLLGDESPDLLINFDTTKWFESERINTTNTHGTGCSLSSAVASFLGQGYSIGEAILLSKRFMVGAIENADRLSVGKGHGPIHHFWNFW